jgi:double-stranded uracil-DNA glycosylase
LPIADKVAKSVAFEVVARADARVLVLGSLPGQVSLQRREYYAQPRNAFWRIMGEIAGASPDVPYKDRLRRLIGHGIALWDVCAAGCRAGSLDSAIELSTVETNDFSEFLRVHSDIALICFNGQKAKEIFDRKVRQEPPHIFARVRYEVLPSTSPAHAGMSYQEKLARWRAALGKVRTARSSRRHATPPSREKIEIYASLHGGR